MQSVSEKLICIKTRSPIGRLDIVHVHNKPVTQSTVWKALWRDITGFKTSLSGLLGNESLCASYPC
jgi:hypothetical protein